MSPKPRRPALRGLAGLAMAAGVVLGSAGIALADPEPEPAPAPASTTTTATPAPATTNPAPAPAVVTVPSVVGTPTPKPTIVAEGGAAAGAAATGKTAAATGDVLDQLADEYAVGSGGGQLSNLLKISLKMRAMGYKPSKQYLDELQAAMNYRPNQLPLIAALKDTIAYQQKLKAQMEILSQAQAAQNPGSAVMGAGQMPGDSNPAALMPQSAPPAMAPAPATP